jgi:AcrR family transcriptional regulator
VSRLSRDDWAAAALTALSEGGVRGVAVEPLAVRLGTTKGSFYWHFSTRRELVVAALELWERRSTSEVIETVEAAGGTPEQKLRLLFSRAFDPRSLTGVDVRLVAHAGEEPVSEFLDRVTRRRMAYIADLLRSAGHTHDQSARRAAVLYAAFLGNLHLMHTAPDILSDAVGSLSEYADDVVRFVLGP